MFLIDGKDFSHNQVSREPGERDYGGMSSLGLIIEVLLSSNFKFSFGLLSALTKSEYNPPLGRSSWAEDASFSVIILTQFYLCSWKIKIQKFAALLTVPALVAASDLLFADKPIYDVHMGLSFLRAYH